MPACGRFLPILDPTRESAETNAWITVDITQEEESTEMREAKRKRYEKAVDLYKKGEAPRHIAVRLGVSTPTVRMYLEHAAAKGEIELRPEDDKRKDSEAVSAAPAPEETPVEENVEDQTQPESLPSETGADLSPVLDRLRDLETKVDAIQGLPGAVQDLYRRSVESSEQLEAMNGAIGGIDKRLTLFEQLETRVADIDRRLMNMAVRVVELTDKVNQYAGSRDVLQTSYAELHRGIRRLDADRRSMAAALLELLNDLRYHQHGEAGRTVLPSTMPTPQYAGRIAELRDRSEVNVVGEIRSRNGSTDGSHPAAARSAAR